MGLRAESAYGGGIQSIRYRPSTPLLATRNIHIAHMQLLKPTNTRYLTSSCLFWRLD